MSGQMIRFTANGGNTGGYLATPASGKGPAVIVIQEWWGLVPHIKSVCDRFASAGFVALAPDLYHGQSTTSPDEAGRLMMALRIDEAEKDIQGAVRYLLGNMATASKKVGTVGFCMGGQLSLYAASKNTNIGACVDFYGIHPDVKPDFRQLYAPVLGFFGQQDASITPDAVKKLEQQIKAAGKKVDFTILAGVGHAFFNDSRPEVYHREIAERCWKIMLDFFKQNLKSA